MIKPVVKISPVYNHLRALLLVMAFTPVALLPRVFSVSRFHIQNGQPVEALSHLLEFLLGWALICLVTALYRVSHKWVARPVREKEITDVFTFGVNLVVKSKRKFRIFGRDSCDIENLSAQLNRDVLPRIVERSLLSISRGTPFSLRANSRWYWLAGFYLCCLGIQSSMLLFPAAVFLFLTWRSYKGSTFVTKLLQQGCLLNDGRVLPWGSIREVRQGVGIALVWDEGEAVLSCFGHEKAWLAGRIVMGKAKDPLVFKKASGVQARWPIFCTL